MKQLPVDPVIEALTLAQLKPNEVVLYYSRESKGGLRVALSDKRFCVPNEDGGWQTRLPRGGAGRSLYFIRVNGEWSFRSEGAWKS